MKNKGRKEEEDPCIFISPCSFSYLFWLLTRLLCMCWEKTNEVAVCYTHTRLLVKGWPCLPVPAKNGLKIAKAALSGPPSLPISFCLTEQQEKEGKNKKPRVHAGKLEFAHTSAERWEWKLNEVFPFFHYFSSTIPLFLSLAGKLFLWEDTQARRLFLSRDQLRPRAGRGLNHGLQMGSFRGARHTRTYRQSFLAQLSALENT